MSDICDMASEEEAMHINALIRSQVGKSSIVRQTPVATGKCAWCEDDTEVATAIFCCEECAIDWQHHNAKQERLIKISGNPGKI